MLQNTTESIRVPSELMEKIRKICKESGQSYTGYLTSSLYTIVNKDYNKLLKKLEKNAQKMHI
jgi:predicted DNA binding CopG/RHH family protein